MTKGQKVKGPRSDIAFSVETLKVAEEVEGGWENPQGFGISVAGILDCSTGKMRFFTPEGEEILALEKALLESRYIIGFGIKRFDLEVLATVLPRARFLRLRTFDLMEMVQMKAGQRVSLSNLARYTLGRELSLSGIQSPLEWRTGNRGAVRRRLASKLGIIHGLYDVALAGDPLVFLDVSNGTAEKKRAWLDF